MEDGIVGAVERVLDRMWESYHEPLTIDELARTAVYSKFHFLRTFRMVTGVSPGRFLSAIRIAHAKGFLLSTSDTVAQISRRVGYASVSTFSSRFSSSVGLSPRAYREFGGFAPRVAFDARRRRPGSGATVSGTVQPVAGARHDLVFLGLFRDRIPEGQPVSCTVLDGAGRYVLDGVPPGSWFLLAQSQRGAGGRGGDGSVGTAGPVVIRDATAAVRVDLALRARRPVDPPVLLALLDPNVTLPESWLA